MDVETIDRKYEELTGQSQQTVQAVTTLAEKLQAAAQSGDQNAREWMLDLKEIALGIRDEQGQVTELLQAIHGFTANQLQPQSAPAQPQQSVQPQQPVQYEQAPPPQQYAAPPQQYAPPQQQYAPQYQQPMYQPGYGQGGGMFHRFMGSSFGSAIASGAGFGIGDDLINHLFN